MSKFRYSNTASNILSELPIYDGWYQDNKGPYSVYNLPKVADGVTALLTRKKPTDSSDSQKPDPTPPVTPSPQPTPPASDVKPTQMRRLYNPNSGEHFYTANMAEKNHLVKVGRKAEGIGW